MQSITALLILLFLAYGVGYVVLSRIKKPMPPAIEEAAEEIHFIFLLPCLNEGAVIGRSLDRLLELPYKNKSVVVIDDASDDNTYDVVAGYFDRRVSLLRRELPDARRGKGEALNAAYRAITSSPEIVASDPSKVVLCIVDADGRLEKNALARVAPYFSDPKVAAVQIGVRMYNSAKSLLARMQDFEFLVFTEIFQRARHQIGSSGLGGNGQFNRLSGLADLGESPWSNCLTEDLDLGLKLIERGWVNAFCQETYVAQQGVTVFSKLIRQRTRWFQGHLQCWHHMPKLIKARLPVTATIDLLYNLMGPMTVLLLSLSIVTVMVANIFIAISMPMRYLHAVTSNYGLPLIIVYLFSFGFSPIYAYLYLKNTPGVGIMKGLFYAHIYVLYSYIWFISGWKAIFRIVFRKKGWSKTSRFTKQLAILDPYETSSSRPNPNRPRQTVMSFGQGGSVADVAIDDLELIARELPKAFLDDLVRRESTVSGWGFLWPELQSDTFE
ncbi:glycosyltransferase family 2 protein [Acidithrix ferrooxidans]|uniref:Beta-monoglucosyldiacylglycerol synthase n=1 Tax=Acidithrix ferrooxidans TaxID=1280514 RepID=A0A0D8HF80_9ACTN|nr:glycosyltransferase family 2 protein [Acidithrix ferrooxidans]KJF16529.1 beta-monoglucosyldiacylglycerol synthase [Acidithrix ferrooxidans]